MDLYLVSVAAFVATLAALIIWDRKNVDVDNYVMFMRRTQRGRDLIERIASWNEGFWNRVGDVSTVVGIGGMIFAFLFIGYIFAQQLVGPPTAGGPALVLPAPTGEASFQPGYIGVPFWQWIISILLLLVVHEGMHGVMTKTVKSKIESLGLVLFAVIPGAFVEPDEEDLNKKSWRDQVKVYSAGSFANFCLAGVTILFTSFVFMPAFTTPGIGFTGYVNATEYGMDAFPAEEANFSGSILRIEKQRTRNLEEFQEKLGEYSPGDTISVETTEGAYTFQLAENPEKSGEPFLGIAGVSETGVIKEGYRGTRCGAVVGFFRELLTWIFVLNLGIGIMNLLPLKPLDGGLILESISENFQPERSEKIVKGVSSLSLIFLVSALFLSFMA
ncbi:MAG: site-2 protease family protein [Candidatus Aenigmatarchaeota archaeon]